MIGVWFIALLFAAFLVWRFWRRWMLMSLRWPASLHQKQFADMCVRYLRASGLEAERDDGVLDVWINGKQFPGKAPTFLLAFRHSNQVVGELLFKDLAQAVKITGRGPLLLLSPTPVTRQFRVFAEIYNFDVAHVSELKELVLALQNLKKGIRPDYCGSAERVSKAMSLLQPVQA